MKLLLTLLATVIVSTSIAAEAEYHTPADIIKIIDESNIEYQLDQIGKNDKLPQPKLELIEHGIFLKKDKDGSVNITTYESEQKNNPEYNSLLADAEIEFNAHNYSKAREKYQQILNIDPNNAQIMTYLGQVYSEENKPDEAFNMYQKAITINFLDYMAHWFLADMLVTRDKLDEAVHEITIAHLLNRNNPRVLSELKAVYKKAGRSYPEWTFTPRCILTSKSPDVVSLKTDIACQEWFAYSICKAVWQYEPNYRETMMKKTKEADFLVEEHECLLILATSVLIDENKKPTDPAIVTLVNAAKQNKINEYAIYEILLREKPQIAYGLNQTNIIPLIDYLLEIRAAKD